MSDPREQLPRHPWLPWRSSPPGRSSAHALPNQETPERAMGGGPSLRMPTRSGSGLLRGLTRACRLRRRRGLFAGHRRASDAVAIAFRGEWEGREAGGEGVQGRGVAQADAVEGQPRSSPVTSTSPSIQRGLGHFLRAREQPPSQNAGDPLFSRLRFVSPHQHRNELGSAVPVTARPSPAQHAKRGCSSPAPTPRRRQGGRAASLPLLQPHPHPQETRNGHRNPPRNPRNRDGSRRQAGRSST